MADERMSINGIDHQIYTWGSRKNPLILLLHGWLDTGGSFSFLAQQLRREYFLVAPDLRGYGHSGHTPSPLGYFFFEYVADLNEFLKAYSPEAPAVLLGHSLGGGIASVYAGAFPERVKGLINVEGFAFQHPGGRGPVRRAREWLEEMPPKPFPVHRDLENFAERLRKFNNRLSSPRAMTLAKFLTKKVPGGYRMAADPKHLLMEPYSFPHETLAEFWRNWKKPSLFVYAEDSQMAPWFSRDELLKSFPENCRVESIPDCSHAVHHDRPEYLADLIRNFLPS